MRDMFEDSINRILSDQVTTAVLQGAEAGQWQSELFRLLDEGGFTRALAPESAGGVGAGWNDVFPLVFASGRHALPLPLPDSLAACWILQQSGLTAEPGALGLGEAAPDAALTRDGTGWRFSGTLPQVAWARGLDHIVTCATVGGMPHIVLLSRAAAQCGADQNTAREARDRLSFTAARAVAAAPWSGATAVDPVRLAGALVRAGQLAGAMEGVVALSVRYANDRVQFGKPIGKFQAIQQQLAVLASQCASVTAAAEYAFAMADQGDALFAVTCAKQRGGEVAGNAAAIAHAVHGAIGFTYEHTLHYLTRRLWAWRSEFGTHGWWAERLGREVCRTGGAALWPRLTGQSIEAR